MTAADLHDALALLGADLMVRALDALERGRLQLTPQPEDGVTYAAKIDKAEARIDWTRAGAEVQRPYPRPVAVSRRVVRDADRRRAVRVKILRCDTGDGAGAPGDGAR